MRWRRQRSPLVHLPIVGHHSQMPVKQDSIIATPIQPTIDRPMPGPSRLPWSMWMPRKAPDRLSATARTRAVGGSSHTDVRAGGPGRRFAPGVLACTTIGPAPSGSARLAIGAPVGSALRAALR